MIIVDKYLEHHTFIRFWSKHHFNLMLRVANYYCVHLVKRGNKLGMYNGDIRRMIDGTLYPKKLVFKRFSDKYLQEHENE